METIVRFSLTLRQTGKLAIHGNVQQLEDLKRKKKASDSRQ